MMEALFWVGGTVCHQLPERTISVAGQLLPLCARCTGIYTGFFIAVFYFYSQQRLKGNQILYGMQIPLAVLSFLPFMIDGGGSYLGLWHSNNLIRILTGLPAGVSLPYFLILIHNIDIHIEGSQPIYKNIAEQILLLLFGFLLVLLIYNNKLLFLFSAGIAFIGIFLFIAMAINLVLHAIFGKKLSVHKRLCLQCLLVTAWIIGIGALHVYIRDTFYLGR